MLEYYMIGLAVAAAAAYIVFGGNPVLRSQVAHDTNRSPSGLMNFGSTCYFNAVLQALASCDRFCQWVGENNSNNRKFTSHLFVILSEINGFSGERSNPGLLSQLLYEIKDRGWVTEQTQQDAHELYHALIHLIESELRQTNDQSFAQLVTENDENSLTGAVHRAALSVPAVQKRNSPVQGLTTFSMRCKSCFKKTPTRYEAFSSLSLTFPPHSSGPFHLVDLLKYYFLSDNLSDVDCENCSKKSSIPLVKSDFLKEITVGKAPHCICLHIQRLGWYGYHEALKRHDKIIFPAIMDLYGFSQVKKLLNNSRRTSDESSGSNAPDTGCWYRLVAVIEHLGDESGGHFVTYRKLNSSTDQWIYTSDLTVHQVSAKDVFSKKPYMLFYERM